MLCSKAAVKDLVPCCKGSCAVSPFYFLGSVHVDFPLRFRSLGLRGGGGVQMQQWPSLNSDLELIWKYVWLIIRIGCCLDFIDSALKFLRITPKPGVCYSSYPASVRHWLQFWWHRLHCPTVRIGDIQWEVNFCYCLRCKPSFPSSHRGRKLFKKHAARRILLQSPAVVKPVGPWLKACESKSSSGTWAAVWERGFDTNTGVCVWHLLLIFCLCALETVQCQDLLHHTHIPPQWWWGISSVVLFDHASPVLFPFFIQTPLAFTVYGTPELHMLFTHAKGPNDTQDPNYLCVKVPTGETGVLRVGTLVYSSNHASRSGHLAWVWCLGSAHCWDMGKAGLANCNLCVSKTRAI